MIRAVDMTHLPETQTLQAWRQVGASCVGGIVEGQSKNYHGVGKKDV